MEKKVVLAIGAHPDDIEFMMAGTLLLLRQLNYELHIFVVASGSCGSATLNRSDAVQTRLQETKNAAGVLNAQLHEPIVDDLEILYTIPLLRKVAAVVRKVQPLILLTHSPDEYMEDHNNTCRLSVTAAFSRGMINFLTDPEEPPFNESISVYHSIPYGLSNCMDNPVKPDYFVDITSVMEKKTHALACHESQKRWLDESQGLDSYLLSMQEMGNEVGKWSGSFSFAEGWRRHNHLGFCQKNSNPLAIALGNKFLYRK
jgi:N-acetylglucosamine malate deacetylase 1